MIGPNASKLDMSFLSSWDLENFLFPQKSGSWNSFTKITYQRKLRHCGKFWLDYWLLYHHLPFPHHFTVFGGVVGKYPWVIKYDSYKLCESLKVINESSTFGYLADRYNLSNMVRFFRSCLIKGCALVSVFCFDVFHVFWTCSNVIRRWLVLSHSISW